MQFSSYLGSYKQSSSWPSRPLANNDLPDCDPGWLTTAQPRGERFVVKRRFLKGMLELPLCLGVWHSTQWKTSADSWRKALGRRSRQGGRRERWERTRYCKEAWLIWKMRVVRMRSNHEGFWNPGSGDGVGCAGWHLTPSRLWPNEPPSERDVAESVAIGACGRGGRDVLEGSPFAGYAHGPPM